MRAIHNNVALKKATEMPLLPHHVRGQSFDIMQSQVCAWLCRQSEIRQWLFNLCRHSGAIQIDVETGCWRGVNTKG